MTNKYILPLLCEKSEKVTVGLTWFDLFVSVTSQVVEFRKNNRKDGDREAWTGSLGLKWGPQNKLRYRKKEE